MLRGLFGIVWNSESQESGAKRALRKDWWWGLNLPASTAIMGIPLGLRAAMRSHTRKGRVGQEKILAKHLTDRIEINYDSRLPQKCGVNCLKTEVEIDGCARRIQ